MPDAPNFVPRIVRFGAFDVDLHAQELRKHGIRLRLPGQSFLVLKMLLDRPGQLVAREELQKAIWPSDTFVDFDHGLSAAVNRLREALGDSADEPRFVETLPRRGYRFIGTIKQEEQLDLPPAPPAESSGAAPFGVVSPSSTSPARTKWFVWAIAGAALFVTLASLAYWGWRSRLQPLALKPVPFTAIADWVAEPSVSPDGQRVAFLWARKTQDGELGDDIYIKSFGSEDLLRLTYDSAGLHVPIWSPDGSQIAFHQLLNGEGGIFLVPSQGGARKKLVSTHASFGLSMIISWSPDSKQIAYSDSPASGGHKRIQLLNLETLQTSQIEHDDRCEEEMLPAFSRDGTQLAYACFTSQSDFSLSLVNSAGASPRIVQHFHGFLQGFDWSADGKRLIFSDGEALYELLVANGASRRVASLADVGRLSISPRGNRLVYTRRSGGNQNIWRADLLHPTASPIRLISTTRDQLAAEYSPDGKHILFVSNRTGSQEIWMSDPEGANLVQLTDFKGSSDQGTPRWSPDSTKIVFDSRIRHPDHAAIYILDVTQRIPHKLEVSTGEAAMPSWSRDGKWIYFLGGTDDVRGERIYRVSPQGGRAQPVTSARGFVPQESVDGQSIYFATHSNPATLEAASLNPTGTEYPVPSMPQMSWVGNWTITRNGVYFFPASDFLVLSFYDFATKQVHPILKTSSSAFFGLSVSPDGKYILYAQIDEGRADVMVVNNFH